jgi:ketosteroid isomerase-like protein
MSLQKGIKSAFVGNLANDAIVFRPGPINGREFWSKREPSRATLQWHPTFADVAASGELGYTTGPSLFTPPAEFNRPQHGFFFSIWKKTAEGVWKVALDAGISTPAPKKPDSELTFPQQVVSTKKAVGPEPVLLELERSFSTLSKKKGIVTAYSRYLGSDARVMRDGHFPFVGMEAVLVHLKKDEGRLAWTPIASRVASSFDLGYTYGKYEFYSASAKETGHYVHVWKKQSSGAWKVVLDVHQPMPKE